MASGDHVSAAGAAEAAHALAELGARMTKARPAMRAINRHLESEERKRWAQRAWPARADGTPAGVDSGALSASLTSATAPGAIRDARDDQARFGSNLPQAGLTQGGTSRQPPRQVLDIDQNDNEPAKILARHIMGELPR